MQQPTIVKRESVIDHVSETWIECVMTAVWRMLDEQNDGAACITTPSGRACHVTVRFTTGGRA